MSIIWWIVGFLPDSILGMASWWAVPLALVVMLILSIRLPVRST